MILCVELAAEVEALVVDQKGDVELTDLLFW